jgi:hypothetical protein
VVGDEVAVGDELAAAAADGRGDAASRAAAAAAWRVVAVARGDRGIGGASQFA